jgi:hypothetical protein
MHRYERAHKRMVLFPTNEISEHRIDKSGKTYAHTIPTLSLMRCQLLIAVLFILNLAVASAIDDATDESDVVPAFHKFDESRRSSIRGGLDAYLNNTATTQPPQMSSLLDLEQHRKLIIFDRNNGPVENKTWIVLLQNNETSLLQSVLKNNILYGLNDTLNTLVVTGISTNTLGWLLNRSNVKLVEEVSATGYHIPICSTETAPPSLTPLHPE